MGGNAGEEESSIATDQLDGEAVEQVTSDLVLVAPGGRDEATMEPSLAMTWAASGCQAPSVSTGRAVKPKPSAAHTGYSG